MPSRNQQNTTPLRTIKDFKSKLIGGGARPNLFEVELAFPDGEGSPVAVNEVVENARFLVKAAALPSSTIAPRYSGRGFFERSTLARATIGLSSEMLLHIHEYLLLPNNIPFWGLVTKKILPE